VASAEQRAKRGVPGIKRGRHGSPERATEKPEIQRTKPTVARSGPGCHARLIKGQTDVMTSNLEAYRYYSLAVEKTHITPRPSLCVTFDPDIDPGKIRYCEVYRPAPTVSEGFSWCATGG
jgi:hypothetical protein